MTLPAKAGKIIARSERENKPAKDPDFMQQTPLQLAAPEAPSAPAEELPPMPDEPPVQQSDAALPWDEPAPQAPPPEEPEPSPTPPAS